MTSLKGGVGKSTVTANLGYSLALRGKQTLVIDCDFNIRNLDLIMGLEDRVVYDFGDAVRGSVKAEKAVIRDPRSEYLLYVRSAVYRFSDTVGADIQRGDRRAIVLRTV